MKRSISNEREKLDLHKLLNYFWTNYFNFKGRSRRSEIFAMLWHLIL